MRNARRQHGTWWKTPLASLLLLLVALLPAVLRGPTCATGTDTMSCCAAAKAPAADAGTPLMGNPCHCPVASWSTAEWIEERAVTAPSPALAIAPLAVLSDLSAFWRVDRPAPIRVASTPPPGRISIHLRNLSIRC